MSQIPAREDHAFLVGITGMIGGGKSTAAKILEELGAFRISADEIARKYTDPDSPIADRLVEVLGTEILGESGKPDRKKIANLVFGNREKLEELNRLVHPRIREEFRKILKEKAGGRMVAWEVPLLFETDSYLLCDSTVCVVSDPNTSLLRAAARDGISLEEAEMRAKNQLTLEEKAKRADSIIRNLGNLEDLRQECVKLFAELKGRMK
ncbi:dephospho-CoA kinase [Leptospira fletcheri]|uniref:Dephospho-CoA kinase n=1 Tax=Leptospira fletcheri TaxID=2484981 RepID=A0A4R9G5P6_9LEPT|nr:dephospho-CoA kinase [Leptospira fletcheri]TGK06485.1 dephospho-CoA kinase [Leptospira fletcheri]